MTDSVKVAHFNSIKVRLERAEARRAKANGATFQFHKGTIRTFKECLPGDKFKLFQFHKGTIRTLSKFWTNFTCVYFNSIKVRLELGRSFEFWDTNSFQFHKGTIRTKGRLLKNSLFRNFNSIKVRLEHCP